MTLLVKVNGEIIAVVSGAVKDVVYGIVGKTQTVEQAKKYLVEQGKIPDTDPEAIQLKSRLKEFGYVDFDQLIGGNPSIVGDFYKKNTVFGRMLTKQSD